MIVVTDDRRHISMIVVPDDRRHISMIVVTDDRGHISMIVVTDEMIEDMIKNIKVAVMTVSCVDSTQ